MKAVFSVLVTIFSLNAFAAGNCGLSFWNEKIDGLNESYANGQIEHQAYFTQMRNFQKMIAINTYECIFSGKTDDLSKEAIQASKKQFELDRAAKIELAQKRLDFELKHGSTYGAVESKMMLEEVTAKFNKIQMTMDSL